MKTIILEGIASSGKSTVHKHLEDSFAERGRSLKAIPESETLMPILHNTDSAVSLSFLKELYQKYDRQRKLDEIFLFDRFYFTHIFRTQSSVRDFQEFENMLKDDSHIVLLTIKEDQVMNRINLARSHRSQQWSDYVSKKGTEAQIEAYYIEQQRILVDICKESSVPHSILDTTDMNFERVVEDLKEIWKD